MTELAPIIKDLTVILSVAGLVTLIFQKIRQPVVLGYLVAGMIVGPYTPPHALVSDIPNIKVLAELGVIFLMFSLGLDFSFHKLTKVGFSASITGLLEVIFMMAIGFVAGHAIGWSFYDSLFLGAAMAISSTTIIIKALEEFNLTKKRFAEVIFGILVIEDLLAILILVALSTVVITKNIFSLGMLWAITKLILVVSGWFLVGYFLVPYLFRKISRFASSETLTIMSVALCLLLVTLAVNFHYSAALGAFIMGSILAETPQVSRIEELVRPIRDIFAAVFFVSVGMLINPQMILAHLPLVLAIAAITIVGKIITSGLGAFITGQNFENSLRIGFSMAQIGELSFIIVGLGTVLGVTSETLYAVIVAVSVITTFTTPYLIRFSGYASQQLQLHLPVRVKNLLAEYTARVYRVLASSAQQKAYRQATARFIINGVTIAIIFTLSEYFILPQVAKFITSEWMVDIIGCMICVIFSSPFIWGMLFAFKMPKNDVSLAMIVAWVVVIAEVSFLSIAFLETWAISIALLLMIMLLFAFFSQRLERSYRWFEKRLVANVGQTGEKQYETLAPWDTRLVQLTVTSDSPLAGKSLAKCELRQKYDVNVVAIQRGAKIFFSPRGERTLMPNDNVLVLGSEEHIERVRNVIEKTIVDRDDNMMRDFILKSLVLEPENEFVGQTIRDSKIRELTHSSIVGLERNGQRILNPDPMTVLEPNDLLYLCGDAESLRLYS